MFHTEFNRENIETLLSFFNYEKLWWSMGNLPQTRFNLNLISLLFSSKSLIALKLQVFNFIWGWSIVFFGRYFAILSLRILFDTIKKFMRIRYLSTIILQSTFPKSITYIERKKVSLRVSVCVCVCNGYKIYVTYEGENFCEAIPKCFFMHLRLRILFNLFFNN